ncbi:MAG: acetyl-CoA C-acetyltransferase [Planctomycetota bacterium]|jgi:acetyl-CoA C-acetyltransferase
MSNLHNNVVVVSAARTAIGSFGGTLKNIEATELGSIVIREALRRCNLDGAQVDEVLMGQVYTAGVGPNPARIAAIKAGLPYEVPATTVNKLCGSSMKSIALGAQAIMCGATKVVVAGGMENMSRVPYLLSENRWGKRIGHGQLVDVMLQDGLWDCFYDCHMGHTAENLAAEYAITREDQDSYACFSQRRYQKARERNIFAEEIVPVTVPQPRKDPIIFENDEHPRDKVTLDSLGQLKPAFSKDGTVTAGNASGINDGAAAVVLMDEATAARHDLKPMAVVSGFVSVGIDPKIMGMGPAVAIRKLMDNTKLSLDKIDLFEVNEAFAAQILAVSKDLEWNEDKLNVNGGAIALGHPLGATGARITVTLLYEMLRRNSQYGISALCIGGGMGMAVLFERP